MIALPLPLIFCLIILFLLIHNLRELGHWRVFHTLLVLCAFQSLIVALVHYYGVRAVFPVLPVSACALPAMAWIAFRATLIAPFTIKTALPHALPACFSLFCLLFASQTLDFVIFLTTFGYGSAILWSLRPSADLPLARLAAGPVPRRVWQGIGTIFVIASFGDLLILFALQRGEIGWLYIVVNVIWSLSMLVIAGLALIREDVAEPEPQDRPEEPEIDPANDAALMQRLETLLSQEQLFLEPDLTLSRLAKRLHVPIKQLSATINRHTGENVSRYVNGFRIRHACDLLRAGQPVTEVLFASGFNTKSNFNREFLRLMGASPKTWLANLQPDLPRQKI
ncbi:AraC family transcriptional regulator [Tropicibacter sp. R15_0]|uniref:helix-turn-helix domain-containing protein n=1 Tax=Tropicibacter sp. R15_0 TaxID=2821101 RepID=UPI001ADCE0CE|nr:helix-turn-helix domain-containing protein [Tropicibacter sp. R15_0]MBO9465242.1 AraC family transcriptional regulator [Tropicibacter sp. R15_0]